MKKYVFCILQGILVGATIAISLWTLNEATKTCGHSWVDLLYAWTTVLWILTILSFVFKKSVLSMKTSAMTVMILCTLCVGGSIIDTYYAFDIFNSSVGQSSKINQILLCVILWFSSILLGYRSYKLNQKK